MVSSDRSDENSRLRDVRSSARQHIVRVAGLEAECDLSCSRAKAAVGGSAVCGRRLDLPSGGERPYEQDHQLGLDRRGVLDPFADSPQRVQAAIIYVVPVADCCRTNSVGVGARANFAADAGRSRSVWR